MKLVKISTKACGPCMSMDSNLKSIGVSYENHYIDSQDDEIAVKYGVRSVPTLIKLDDAGNEVGRLVGFQSMQKLKEFCL